MRLKTAVFSVAFACASVSAQADGLVAVSALPFSSGPTAYPTAFTGFGYGLGFSYQYAGTPYAGTVRAISQGDGSLYALAFRYYLKGKMWTIAPDPNRQDVELQIRPRVWSLYLEAGPALYSATRTVTNGTVSVTGATVLFSAGIDRPIWGYSWGARMNYFNSATNSVHAFSGEVYIGFPIGI
jgi:hypothetical protein